MNDEQPRIVQDTIGAMQDLTTILWSAAALLAPWLVPLAPAAFFGLALWETASKTDLPDELAIAVGVAGAVGLETVNIAAAHAAIQLSHKRKEHGGKFALSILLVVFYVIAGVGSMLMLDVPLNTRVIGIAMFLLAPVAITAQALTMDLKRVRDEGHRQEQLEADERQRRWEMEEAQAKRDHQRRLELDRLRWQHKTEVALSDTVRQVAVSQAPAVGRWQDKTDFLADSDRPADITPSQLAKLADISERTAYRWLEAAGNGKQDVG